MALREKRSPLALMPGCHLMSVQDGYAREGEAYKMSFLDEDACSRGAVLSCWSFLTVFVVAYRFQ